MQITLELAVDRVDGNSMVNFYAPDGRVNILLNSRDMDPIRMNAARNERHISGRIVLELGHLLIESIGAASETDEVRQFISHMRDLGLASV